MHLILKGWLATDEDGHSYLHKTKPDVGLGGGYWVSSMLARHVGKNVINQTFKDEPRKVELYIKEAETDGD
jgi:hypothetical protein